MKKTFYDVYNKVKVSYRPPLSKVYRYQTRSNDDEGTNNG